MNTNIAIRIAADFVGKQAFGQAQTAVTGLEGAADKLGKKLAGAFSVYKIAQYSKASLKAYADDQRASALLAQQLKNLGLGDATAQAQDFIGTLEKQTGILDDQLRPAYEQLARVTGSITKTQDLLKLAFDVSKGSGTDFASTVDALSQAYVGNYKGLKQLNLGLTQAELSSKSFSDIQAILNKQFGGAGAASMNTYAGQIDALNVALANASETIGKSLFDALALVSGDQGFGGFIDKIDTAASKVASLITVMSRGIRTLEIWLNPKATFKEKQDQFKQLQTEIWAQDLSAKQRAAGMKVWNPTGAYTPALKKAEQDAIARNKQLLAIAQAQQKAQADILKKKQDQAKLDQASLSLKKAEGLFNMDQIEIAAAMLNRQSAEDYARLKLKKDILDLQDAINAQDVVAATALAKKVEDDYKVVAAYQQQNILAAIQANLVGAVASAAKTIPENKSLIDLDNLNAALKAIAELIAKLTGLKVPNLTTTTPGGTNYGAGKPFNPNVPTPPSYSTAPPDIKGGTYLGYSDYVKNLEGAKAVIEANTKALQPIVDSGFFDLAFMAAESTGGWLNPYQMTAAEGAAYSGSQVNVTVMGSVTTEKDLIDAIVSGLNDVSASGVKPFVNRLNPEYL